MPELDSATTEILKAPGGVRAGDARNYEHCFRNSAMQSQALYGFRKRLHQELLKIADQLCGVFLRLAFRILTLPSGLKVSHFSQTDIIEKLLQEYAISIITASIPCFQNNMQGPILKILA